ncbi:hypothetical protein AFCA_007383 [Aspergillus flavus]|nr:hypothetical protein AFCA_007383 [Aspergillus flavus]
MGTDFAPRNRLRKAVDVLVATRNRAKRNRFDDLEDESQLRRGKPATHMLYGPAQTINSAVYALVNTFSEVQRLDSSETTEIFIDELQNLHCGQSFDLYWKYHGHIPTVEEYMMMIDHSK